MSTHALEPVRRYDILPRMPFPFCARHQLPVLSIISKISPLEKEISFGSPGSAVSAAVVVKINYS
jgi:hypothetical protein